MPKSTAIAKVPGKRRGRPAVPVVDDTTSPIPVKGGLYCSLCWEGSREGTARNDKENGDDDDDDDEEEEDQEEMLLCQCHDCGTLYHNECYRNYSLFAKEVVHKTTQKDGGEGDNNNQGLEKRVYIDQKTGRTTTVVMDTCIACAAVGQALKGRTRRGKQHTVEVTTRPYECCLCSVDSPDLPLPMHPIYDRNNGRPLLLEKKHHSMADVGGGGPVTTKFHYRPAWCHTLCARVIGSNPPTGGCVYSCDPRGKYYGFEGDDDDRSISSEIETAREHHDRRRLSGKKKKKKEEDEELEEPEYGVHHYCIVLQPAWKNYIQAIKIAQKFTCLVCGKDDKPADVYRIPVACVCNEKHEPNQFTACHSKADLEKECLKALHVGCAVWGRRINGVQKFPPVRRLHFQPNTVGGDDFFVLYCDKHAVDIRKKGKEENIDGYNWLRYPKNGGKIGPRPVGKASKEPSDTDIVNTSDTIESDDEDYKIGDTIHNEGGVIDLDFDKGGIARVEENGAKRERKHKDGKITKVKKRKVGASRKEETARDRLEKKMAKNKKIAAGAATLTSHTRVSGQQSSAAKGATAGAIFPATPENDKDPLADIHVPRKSSFATTVAEPTTPLSPKLQSKREKNASLRLAGLFDGSGVDWNPVKSAPQQGRGKKKFDDMYNVETTNAADTAVRLSPAFTIPRKSSISSNSSLIPTAAPAMTDTSDSTLAIAAATASVIMAQRQDVAEEVYNTSNIADNVVNANDTRDSATLETGERYASVNENVSDAELGPATLDVPRVDPTETMLDFHGHDSHGDDESDIDWAGGEAGEILESETIPLPPHNDHWQKETCLEYILPPPKSPTSALGCNVSESHSIEEGEIRGNETMFLNATAQPAAEVSDVTKTTTAAQIDAVMAKTSETNNYKEPLVGAASDPEKAVPLKRAAAAPEKESVVAPGQLEFALTGEEKERSNDFFSQIMDEISLKRKYRQERNDLENILDNVELHWQAELTRCGIKDAEAFFRIIRTQAKAEHENDQVAQE